MKKKSEKLLSVILAVIAGLCFMPSVGTVFKANAAPEEQTERCFSYTIENGEATITNCENIAGNLKIPNTLGGYPVTAIRKYAFACCTKLTGVKIPEGVTSIGDYAFEECTELTDVIIPDTVTGIGNYVFAFCGKLKMVFIPETVEKIGWQTDTPELIINRKSFEYPYYNEDAKLKKVKTNLKYINGYCDSYFSSITSYDPVTLVSAEGEIYALCGIYTDKALLSSQKSKKAVYIREKGFSCGAGIIGDDNMLYLIWAKYASDETFDKSPRTKNVKVVKYSLSGAKKGEYGFRLDKTYSMIPYDAGNAALAYNNGTLCVLWNTEWNGQYTNDGLHHQGMEFALLNTKDMTCIEHSSNSGSHSFGVYLIKTERGFGIAQLGDAYSRGLNFFEYNVADNEYSDMIVAFSSPGQYGSNERHLDGNATYVSDIGFAQSKTTFAFCAYGTDVYTSKVFYNNKLRKKAKYDVYVRILDKSLSLNGASDCAGSNRINAANGKIADKNIVRITNLNKSYSVRNVKIVTLTDGAYCVLWNQQKDYNTNWELYYAVLDEKGNILKKATKVKGGLMSDYNMPPIVQNGKLIWAVGDNNKISWMILDLKASEIKTSEIKTNSIKLTWKNVEGAKYYRVEISNDGKTWKTLTVTDGTSYSVKSLKAGAEYRFKVTALDSRKESLKKNPKVIKTGTLTDAPSISLKSSKSKTAVVSWKKVNGASKYVVYKSFDKKKWTKAATVAGTSYTLTKLAGGKKLYSKVTALNADGRASQAGTVKSVTVKK